MRIGSLFSGAGGLDLAVEAVFGGEVIWHSELDKAASKVLAYRFPCAPNLGDITQIDWATVEPVDVLCGGFPCQDVSAAGKRAGIKDGTRSGLWAIFADAIDALRPRYVVIENVRGLLSATAHRAVESDDAIVGDGSDRPVLRALGAVLGDLSDLGYDAVWATVSAASVGAPHRRERVFILATDTGYGDESERAWASGRQAGERQAVGDVARRDSDDAVELLPTPCVVDRLATGEMTLEEWDESRRSQKERGVGSFGPRGDSLGAAILRVEEGTERPDYSTTKARRGGDEPGVALLPTPAAGNFNDGEEAEQWLARQAAVKERLNNGNGMGMPLAIAVQLLPTPTTQDGANNGGPSQFQRNTLPLNAEVTLLPTPVVTDSSDSARHTIVGGTSHPGTSLTDAIRLLPTPCAQQSGNTPENHLSKKPGRKVVTDLAILVENGLIETGGELLPTPRASDPCGAELRSSERFRPQLGEVTRGLGQHWGKYALAIHRWEQIVGSAPAPTEPNKNGNPRLSAAFSEWLMGWPAGWVTDPDIGITRNDQLRIVGNGVCTQQAVAALRFLLSVAS